MICISIMIVANFRSECSKRTSIAEKLSPLESEMVIIAAWFHDTDISKELKIMKTKVYTLFLILKEKDKSDEYIQKIASIIRATTFNHVPQTLLEKNNQGC
jgi:hypothetical protein